MEEKLKRLKQFNRKSKQSSQRKECKWCGVEIKQGVFLCASCHQPQRKRHWLLAHPSVAVAAISLAVSLFSLHEANKAPVPKLLLQAPKYSEKNFTFLVTNYGRVPTQIQEASLNISFRDEKNHTMHKVQSVFSFDDPELLPPNSSRNLDTPYSSYSPFSRWSVTKQPYLDFDKLLTAIVNWEMPDSLLIPSPYFMLFITKDEQGSKKARVISLLDILHDRFNNNDQLNCELTLRYSTPESESQKATSSHSTNCFDAFEWMGRELGPLKDKTLPIPWFWDEKGRSPNT